MGMKELQERREKLRAEYAEAESKQAEVDYAALVDAEEEYGFGAVQTLKVKQFQPGLPTFVVLRNPGGTPFYRKYLDEMGNAKSASKKQDANAALGVACLVYPPKGEIRDRMLQAFPGLSLSAGLAAQRLAELDAEDEKKE